MVSVKKHGVVLDKTSNNFENESVLNPAVYQDGNTLHMFYRATEKGGRSTIGYAKFEGPTTLVERKTEPIISPTEVYEASGVEDPRIVRFEDKFYMFYTAFNGKSSVVAYAVSEDLMTWEKKGIISSMMSYSQAREYMKRAKLKDDYFLFEAYIRFMNGEDVLVWDKDAFIFPERINGKIAFVHRILPDMQIAYVDSFYKLKNQDFWINYFQNMRDHILMEGMYAHELRNIGGGAPPIKTDKGWLLIFHSVRELNSMKMYSASAALCDLTNPQKILGRTSEPLFIPTEVYELAGVVNNVVFPTGTAIFDDTLYIYYGAADLYIAVASVKLSELLNHLLHN